jgi:glycosyltransferase involved in cell wall biosynthesis
MNVFFIPSWYPSETDPLPGIFFRDQALALAKHYEDIKIGISTWGQNDERLLLWSRKPLQSLWKLLRRKPRVSKYILLEDKVVEYHNPCFTWSRRLFGGNLERIIEANLESLRLFSGDFGAVDILHAHVGYPGGYIAKVISEKTDIPYVITEQMSPFPHKYFKRGDNQLLPDLKQSYDQSSRNIAISGALQEEMKRLGVQKIEVIPNLVDESVFLPLPNRLKPTGFTFFCLGRMVPQKGIDILLTALSLTQYEMEVRIGGAGPFLGKYKKMVGKLDIRSKIVWLGEINREQALREFQRCNAFVLPSRHESMGVVFAEAMACGRPVIATICGGPEEFVDESVGFLIPSNDADALAGAIEKMIIDFDKFDASTIRRKFEERLSSKFFASRMRRLYDEVVS